MTKKPFHCLGRRAHVDPNDHRFLLAEHLPDKVSLPSSRLWAINGQHLDQGRTNTCVGHAWRNFLRCAPVQTRAKHPSEFDIYRAAVLRDLWKDNDGEAELPDGDPGLVSGTSVRAGAQAVAAEDELTSYVWAFSLQPTLEWLLTQGPVVVGVNWYDSFESPDASGRISISPGAQIVGGHSFLVRGANQVSARARCVQTWGNDWAKKGDFFLSYRDLDRLIAEDGEVCTAIQKRKAKGRDR